MAEVSVTANQGVNSVQGRKIKWGVLGESMLEEEKDGGMPRNMASEMTVRLVPMQVRTFWLNWRQERENLVEYL